MTLVSLGSIGRRARTAPATQDACIGFVWQGVQLAKYCSCAAAIKLVAEVPNTKEGTNAQYRRHQEDPPGSPDHQGGPGGAQERFLPDLCGRGERRTDEPQADPDQVRLIGIR